MSPPQATAKLCAISLLARTCMATACMTTVCLAGICVAQSGGQIKAQSSARSEQRSKAKSRVQRGTESVLHAEKFKGLDAGEKITQCLAALPETGGVCDARNLAGEQHSANGFTVGSGSKPAQLVLGPTTLIVAKTIFVQARSSITGMPSASGIAGYQGASVIKANAGANLAAVVQ